MRRIKGGLAYSSQRRFPTDYAASFGGLPPELAKAYREGDWEAVVGKAIYNLDRELHQIRPFKPPRHWTKFMVIDWGTAAPFSIGWYCVSDGDAVISARSPWKEVTPARGALIRYDEWYGWDGKPNHGCRMVAQTVAKKIRVLENERKEVMDYRVGDTEMWAQRGGPSVETYFRNENVILRKSRKDRQRNYSEVLARLAGNQNFLKDGKLESDPQLYITANCIHFWRTVPSLILDPIDPEKGPDTKLEDHVYDEVAYACRSRPFVTTEEDRYNADWAEDIKAARGAGSDPYDTS